MKGPLTGIFESPTQAPLTTVRDEVDSVPGRNSLFTFPSRIRLCGGDDESHHIPDGMLTEIRKDVLRMRVICLCRGFVL